MAAPEFKSSLDRPWVLIQVQGNGQPGRRRPTAIAWLEYRNADGIFDGGPVYFGRDGRWHFQYKHSQKISPGRVLYTFPCYRGRAYGPTTSQIRTAKATVPLNPEDPAP